MIMATLVTMDAPLAGFIIARADDALILGHRLSEWCSHAPTLEEDLALANMALDLLGQARELYSYAAAIIGNGATEDSLAYLRGVSDYQNLLLLELRNGDFGFTIMRSFLFSSFSHLYWSEITRSNDAHLSAIALKSTKEIAYHLRYTSEWVIRLGDGTEYSFQRMHDALNELWPFTGEMFEVPRAEEDLVSRKIVTDPTCLHGKWIASVSGILRNANLTPPTSIRMHSGGRSGRHTEHLGHLLSELQYLQRTYPGVEW